MDDYDPNQTGSRFFMTAALLSSAFAPAALADNKTKVGKICLTVDSDIRAGSSGGEVDVTPTGDNTDLYYVDAVEVVNDEGTTGPNPILLR